MRIGPVARICCFLVLLCGWVVIGKAIGADAAAALQKDLQEMPVLTGETWQTMAQDSKIAFIWGVGHVVTIEDHVIQRHPELLRKDFVTKLGEGLRGVPMSSIIEQVDGYYRQNPEDLDLPVMRVIWAEIVRPRIKAGIADRPFAEQLK